MEKYKVLIVEDEKDTQFILDKLLVKNGYETKTTSNGVEALNVLKNFNPVVILADWTMPVMDGLETTKEIRRRETGTGRRTPIIAVTARAMHEDRDLTIAAGMDGYIPKPIRSPDLYAIVDGCEAR